MSFPKIRGYEITKKLGEGGYGVVYLAISKKTGGKVAIKISTFKITKTAQQAEKFFNDEVKILQDISRYPNCNPYFLCIIDHITIPKKSGNIHALITEYIDGYNLYELTTCMNDTKHRLSEEDLITLIEHLLIGLNELHSRGIVHRDIKAENIMFNDNKLAIKLIDFGGACSLASSDSCFEHITGTIGLFDQRAISYAISQKKGKGSIRLIEKSLKANDVYALGRTIWELATLKNVQEYEPEEQLEPISNYGYSHKLTGLVYGLTINDWKVRYTAEEALKILTKQIKTK